MPGRYRWMYYATGLPGWMRFGFSPGWIGRSPTGLGPCATYMMTGRWPAPLPVPSQEGQEMASTAQTSPTAPFGLFNPFAQMPKEQQVRMLEEQANAMKAQLEEIKKRLEELTAED